MMMNEKMRVEVIWHDAHTVASTWIEFSDIGEDPCEVTTLGWLLADAKPDHVVVAQSMTDDDSLDSVLCIPVGMVKKVRIIPESMK
jgi:hypothetical protein